ncbi:MAG: nuclear transport factor 2 family protein [Acidobacteria bacterium]|nr:nuclear transport factor 2 family protein [Acidobacteriota bacterium]
MMIRRVLLTLAACAVLGLAGDDEAGIRAAEKAWTTAIKAKDARALGKLLDDTLIYAHSTGIVDSKQDYIVKVTSGRQLYVGAEHEQMTMRFHGPSTAIVHARMHMWGTNKAGKFDDIVMAMHTWVKGARGAWRLVAHQTTKIK